MVVSYIETYHAVYCLYTLKLIIYSFLYRFKQHIYNNY